MPNQLNNRRKLLRNQRRERRFAGSVQQFYESNVKLLFSLERMSILMWQSEKNS